MKFIKLFFVFSLFLFSLGSYSQDQDKRQFVKEYNYARSIDSLGVKSEWIKVDCRVFFNYGNNPSKLKIYINNSVDEFSQISETRTGKTSKGYEYYELHLLNNRIGEEIFLFFFLDERFGIQLMDFNKNILELNNPIK